MSFTFPRLWTLAPRRGGILAVALVVLGVLVGLSVAGAASVGPVQNVSRDNAGSIGPQVAQDPDGNIHVVWISDESNTRVVRYAKGTWNGSTYNIGGSSVLAEVGGFGYASPTVAVAPNGILMAAWSDGTLHTRAWNSRDNQPSGGTVDLGQGIEPSIAPDSANRFHIAWSGNFQVQYCQWAAGACQVRDAWSSEEQGSSRPDIAVDSNNGVHVVWGGQGQVARYRARAANAGWGQIQDLANGVTPQIAADGQGNVHIVWSQNFDIQYCRRTLGTGCTDQRTFSAGNDVTPSIGATQGGRLVVVFRNLANNTLWYAAREDGNWSGAQQVATGPTAPDATPRSYTDRISFVWSLDFDIQLATVTPQPVTVPATPTASPTGTPQPTATPTATPLPNAPATGAFDIANNDFRNVWTRTDLLVLQNAVTHSWIWGPAPFTQSVNEEYAQSPGGQRQVQYFDKSRMEINQPNAPRGQYYVTNGRLADELITGLLQFGDAQYRQREPAAVAVAGDPQNTFPLYRDLRAVYRRARPDDHANQYMYRGADGSVQTSLLANANTDPSMLIVQRIGGLGIPRIFWDFMNRPGRVVENGSAVNVSRLFDWRYVIGEPLTEAYWTTVKVGGVDRSVLVQAFERRVLTYTPTNVAGFQVEMGNIGRHYFEWRYGVRPR